MAEPESAPLDKTRQEIVLILVDGGWHGFWTARQLAQRLIPVVEKAIREALAQQAVNFEELARAFEQPTDDVSHPEYHAGRQFCADALRLAMPASVKKALEDHDAELWKKWSTEETHG